MTLDTSARSVMFNFLFDAENTCRVELVPEVPGHRVPVDQLEIYYRNGISFTKLEKNQWVGTKDNNGRIIIRFTPVVKTQELKIHCNYDDLNSLQAPIDLSEFYNSPEKLVTVYQKIIARTETYIYDGIGNRLTEQQLLRKQYDYNYEYYSNSNRLMKSKNGKWAYNYDQNGNLIEKGNTYTWNGSKFVFTTKGDKVEYWKYTYDLLNQMVQVGKNEQVVASYIYDPTGFRVEKQGSQGKIHYVPLLNGEVGYRKEFNSGKEYSFIYVGGTHLARVNGVIGGDGPKYFYTNDHLGTALAITDESGNKVVERDFAPFGERLQLAENDGIKPDEDGSAFTGKDWDQDIGLYYYNARFYDPEIGRFISEDSVIDPNNQGNAYVYVANNPVNNIDPSGHWACNVNWGKLLDNFTAKLLGYVISQIPGADTAMTLFTIGTSAVNQLKWANFVKKYSSMNEEDFKKYLQDQGIKYDFDSTTNQTTFVNSEGQTPVTKASVGATMQKTLTGDQKLAAFKLMQGNINEFLENNPGLNLEQVRGLFDSAVLSADSSWGFGKNEFRYEGRGAKLGNGLYSAEAILMNEGMVTGVLTDTSTLADSPFASVGIGVYDYVVGYHHLLRTSTETGKNIITEIGQDPPRDPSTGQYYTYDSGKKDKNGNIIYNPIDKWSKGTYKGLHINVPGRRGIASHSGGIYLPNAVHPSYWTGSEGCMTTYENDYLTYMNLYNWGDSGKFIVVNKY